MTLKDDLARIAAMEISPRRRAAATDAGRQNACAEHVAKVTRFEVIDETGRIYSAWRPCSVQLSFQDDGRTLKVFVTPKKADGR